MKTNPLSIALLLTAIGVASAAAENKPPQNATQANAPIPSRDAHIGVTAAGDPGPIIAPLSKGSTMTWTLADTPPPVAATIMRTVGTGIILKMVRAIPPGSTILDEKGMYLVSYKDPRGETHELRVSLTGELLGNSPAR